MPLLTLPEHLSSPLCLTRSLVLCVCLVDRCLSFCPFSFDHCVVYSSAIYGFGLPFGIFKHFLFNLIYNICWYISVSWNEIKEHCDVPTKSELQQNKNPELQLDQHVTAWTASWVNGNHWAYFHGHYLFLHEDKYYMRNKNNKITNKNDK